MKSTLVGILIFVCVLTGFLLYVSKGDPHLKENTKVIQLSPEDNPVYVECGHKPCLVVQNYLTNGLIVLFPDGERIVYKYPEIEVPPGF